MGNAVVLSFPPYGHLTPALEIARELGRRGERVFVYATGRAQARVEAAGATFRRYPRGYESFNPEPPTDGLFSDMARFARLSEEMLPELLDQVAADAPDYLLLDTKSLWGRLVAQILKRPAATLSVVFAIRPGLIPVTELVQRLYAGAPRERWLAGVRGLGEYLEVARRLGAHFGATLPGIIEYLGNPQPLNIVYTSREFQIQGGAFDASYQFVGPLFAPGRGSESEFPWEALGSRPLVYVSLGTTFHHAPRFYEACFAALGDLDVQVVLATGPQPEGALQPPANFLARSWVPQLELLRRADVFVTHGGMNSANEGLYFGVPLVAVPQRGDQFLVGARVAELGAGVMLTPPEVHAEGVRAAVTRVLGQPEYRVRARALSEGLRAAGGAARAAELILDRLAAPRMLCS